MFDDCWNWRGKLNATKRGRLWIRGKLVYAHRVAYESAYGPILPKQIICHICNNPTCVNPAHLYAGSFKDNWEDAKNFGWTPRHGELHPRAKINQKIIQEIKKRKFGTRTLAKIYKVNRSTIQNVLRGKTWTR